jgi:23S rRNA pseudouridine955/2504/2580 synthase
MREIIISELEANQRLDKFLLKYLKKCPKSYLYKCMRTNKIKYNGKKVKGNELLQIGGILKIFLGEEQLESFLDQEPVAEVPIQFKAVYQDKHLLVVNKPLGLLTQKDEKEGHSLAEEVIYYLAKEEGYTKEKSKGFIPAPANRLDRNTAGIVLVGKTLPAAQSISHMLKTKQISKYYISVVLGKIDRTIYLSGYHIKHKDTNKVQIVDHFVEGAKPVETRIMPLQTNGRYTLVEVQLITGKTHQIRAHLKQIGHPIIGDDKYGDSLENKYFKDKYHLHHQFLCAYKIKFEEAMEPMAHLQNRVFTVPVPKIYSSICKGEGFIKL